MFKTTIYQILLTVMLMLLPFSMTAQQANDIKKPTRTRVTEKDKKNTNVQKTVESKDTKNDTKNDTKTVDKKDNKAPEKPVVVKDEKAQVKQEPAKPATDSTAKPATPPKPKKTPVDPSKVQFDGIDVSKHQGNINWEELKKNTKIKFVYIKATEGSNYVDPKYKENIRNARKHGFKVGSYHYFTDLSSARMQFQNFIQNTNRDEQDLLPVIDVEKRNKWSPQQLRDSVKVFADLIEDYYGCKPLIYTFETFFNKNLGKAFDKYPIFIAKYPKGQEEPNINGVKWVLWQFSECGRFKGVKDNLVDMSRFNKGYTIEDILYKPGKSKPKSSVKDAVDHKEKPTSVNMTEQKPAPQKSKRQLEEEKRKAEKEKKVNERNKKVAEEEAKKKAEADKKAKEKAKEKAEQQKKEQARQAAREEAAKKEAEAKAKRKAEAAKAREQKAKQQEAAKKNSKSTNLLNATSSSKLSQTQRNDSIRNAQLKGRKNNKSSADND